jgi:hypothetical protein
VRPKGKEYTIKKGGKIVVRVLKSFYTSPEESVCLAAKVEQHQPNQLEPEQEGSSNAGP